MFKDYEEFLNEARGVPENIVNVASQLFDKILSQKFDNTRGEDLNGVDFTFKGPFHIGSKKVNNIIFEFGFSIFPHIEGGIEIERLGQLNRAMVASLPHANKLKLINKPTSDVHILMSFVADRNVLGKEIKTFLEKRRATTISDLAHELHHGHEESNRGINPVSRAAEYQAYSNIGIELRPLARFIESLYFTHETENIVRASEVSAEMKELGITKKEFNNFISSNLTYKTLKQIREKTYESFRKELLDNVDKIKEWLERNKFPVEGKNNDALVDDMLRNIYFYIVNVKGHILRNMLIHNKSNPIAQIFRMMEPDDLDKQKQVFFEKFMKRISRFQERPIDFYKEEIEKASKSAGLVMKKLSKLYADAPDASESIKSFNDFENELQLSEGWKENLVAGAVAIMSLVGHAKAQPAPLPPGHIHITTRIGTQVDGVIGQFTSQFVFPDAYMTSLAFDKFEELGIDKNSTLAQFVKGKISKDKMLDWNDFVSWMKEKLYSGDPKMDHFQYSDAVLQEYLKDHKDFWIKNKHDVKLVQAAIKLYRVHVVNKWKAGKSGIVIDKKILKYSKANDKLFMTWAR